MKSRFLRFVFLLMCATSFAQTQDLISLSMGTYVGFDVILDKNGDVYGYVSIYSMCDSDEVTEEFEAVLLDKNLNKVSNIEFSAPSIIDAFQTFMNLEGKIILLPYAYVYYSRSYKYDDMLEANFKQRETKPYKFQCYSENGDFEDCKTYKTFREKRKDDKTNYKEKGYIYDSDVYNTRNGYSLVLERKRHKKFYNDVRLKVFNEKKELKWERLIEDSGSKEGFSNVELFWKNLDKSDNIYAVVSYFGRGQASSNYLSSYENVHNTKHWKRLLGYNLETGEQVLDEQIAGRYTNAENVIAKTETGDYLVDVRTIKNNFGNDFGFRCTKIGLKDNTIHWDDLSFKSMMGQIERLNEYGMIGGNYKLNPIAAFVNQDGSVYILTEEYKSAYNVLWGYNVNKNKDFYLIRTNQDFQLQKIDRIEKTKSKYAYTDFLFWQRLSNDNNDIAFFYTDKRQGEEKKQKYRVLGVCTIIDGQFKMEELKIASKSEEFFIAPNIAKRGFIMLHEFNKKEDYNAVRLERLNY
ncbi:MAG: hypothetical protein AAGF77_08320 [Bacteroidota bacterium]